MLPLTAAVQQHLAFIAYPAGGLNAIISVAPSGVNDVTSPAAGLSSVHYQRPIYRGQRVGLSIIERFCKAVMV